MLWLLPSLKVRAIFFNIVVNSMKKTTQRVILTINILLFFIVVLFHYADILTFSIKGVTPLLILPLLTAFSLFHSPIASGLTGLAAGVFIDANAIGSYCFNAIVLLVIGVFVSVSSDFLFNKNIPSSAVISLITSAFYFILQWLFFHTDNVTIRDSMIYLFRYALPSIILTAIFIFPFYFLYKHFNKILSE